MIQFILHYIQGLFMKKDLAYVLATKTKKKNKISYIECSCDEGRVYNNADPNSGMYHLCEECILNYLQDLWSNQA